MIRVRDARGRVLFHLEGDDAIPRDSAGKILAERAGADDETTKLTRLAARWMRGQALLDLGPGDVLEPSMQADFGIPESDCIGDIVSPIRFVKRSHGYYFLENVADTIQLVVADVAASGGNPVEVQPGFTATKFTTVGRALAAKIPREVAGNADFDLKKRVLRRLVQALRLGRENRLAKLLTTSTNWAAGNRITAVAKWNGGATANPLTDIFAALKASYLPGDTLILPEIAAQYYFSNASSTALRDYVQAYGPLPTALMARSKISYNGSPAYTWMPAGTGGVALVRTTMHREWPLRPKNSDDKPHWAPNDPDTDIGTTETFRWLGEDGVLAQDLSAGDKTARVDGMLVREFVDRTTPSAPTWIVVAHDDIEVMPSDQIGALITGALA